MCIRSELNYTFTTTSVSAIRINVISAMYPSLIHRAKVIGGCIATGNARPE